MRISDWSSDVCSSDLPGGIAVDAGVVYAATGVGEAMALAAEDGRELWRVGLPAPVRGSPTVVNGQVYVVTLDNRTLALSAADGRRLWEHQGINEVAALLGGAAPALSGPTGLAPSPPGDPYPLLGATGRG